MKRAFIAWPASRSIRMRCRARGAKPLKYRWLKDGKEIQRRRLDPYMNTALWYLRLKDLVPSDDGKYTCIVSNKYGSINHTYTLQVVGKCRRFIALSFKERTLELIDEEIQCCSYGHIL